MQTAKLLCVFFFSYYFPPALRQKYTFLYVGDNNSVNLLPGQSVVYPLAKLLCPPIVGKPYATSKKVANCFALLTWTLGDKRGRTFFVNFYVLPLLILLLSSLSVLLNIPFLILSKFHFALFYPFHLCVLVLFHMLSIFFF